MRKDKELRNPRVPNVNKAPKKVHGYVGGDKRKGKL